MMNIFDRFSIKNKIAVITGGAGLLGKKHAEAVIEGGGIAILLDISERALESAVEALKSKYKLEFQISGCVCDITKKEDIERIRDEVLKLYGHIDILINNAANNPKIESNVENMTNVRFEKFPIDLWNEDIAVGLTGAYLCAQVFGEVMARQEDGIILNISSDLGIIAPDQRIYRKEGLKEEEQIVKPVTYSVIKHGLIGLTKYLATYYAEKGVRSNTLCPAGVYNGQNNEFLEKVSSLIPIGRLANSDEYKCTVLYMISDASSYMTGSTVVVDGGRTCW